MKIINDIDSLVSDELLTYMLLILSLLFSFPVIGIIWANKHHKPGVPIKHPNKKGSKVIVVPKKKTVITGKRYIILFAIIALIGAWKLNRDSKVQKKQNDLIDTISYLSNNSTQLKSDLINSQKNLDTLKKRSILAISYDSLILIRMQDSLHQKGIYIDKFFRVHTQNIKEAPLIYLPNSWDIHLDHLNLKRNY